MPTANGRSGGARTRTSVAYGRTTGDHEELRVSRSGFPTIRSPVDGSRCIRVTAYRKLGYQIGRCRMAGKAVRLLYLGPFPRAHLLALSFFSRRSSRSPRSPPPCLSAADVFPSCITEREIEMPGRGLPAPPCSAPDAPAPPSGEPLGPLTAGQSENGGAARDSNPHPLRPPPSRPPSRTTRRCADAA